MARRSRSQHPRKTRNTEAPPPREGPAAAKTLDRVSEPAHAPSAEPLVDELAALDAGWDEPD
jgi:hypothetical protein